MKKAVPWTYKYQPKATKEIVGQQEAVRKLKEFIVNFKRSKKKSALICGPTGTGKTSSVYAIANELNSEVVELNASDFRNKEKISSVIGSASEQLSLFAKSKIILIDEIDGLSGTKDRGSIPAISRIIEKSGFPIILTTIDGYDRKVSGLKKKAITIEFMPLSYMAIYEKLCTIAKKEGISYEESAIKSLAHYSGGDLRAAINDLQTIASKAKRLTREELKLLSEREQQETIEAALTKIFKSKNLDVVVGAFDYVNEDYDKLMLWIDENLPKEYHGKSLEKAYYWLSKADIFSRRIRRWQHWRFMVYIYSFLSAGVALAKDERKKESVSYQQTKRILKLWLSKQKLAKKDEISRKIAESCHCSLKDAKKNIYPFIKQIFKAHNAALQKGIKEELELEAAEEAFLRR